MTRSQAESMIVKSRKEDVHSKRVTMILCFIGEEEGFICTGRLVPESIIILILIRDISARFQQGHGDMRPSL